MKNGFTLMELLAVILLMAIIGLITVPIINNVIKSSKEQAYQTTIKSIEEAARMYVTDNVLDYETTWQKLSLATLKESGLIEEEKLINPINNQALVGCVLYRWNEERNIYEYEYDPVCDTQ